MVKVARYPVGTSVCQQSCVVRTYGINEITKNEPTHLYTHEFFTSLSNERLYRLAKILEYESDKKCSMFGFKQAIFYTHTRIWHFSTIDGLFIITEKQLKSIGTWFDSQSELEDDLIYQSQQVIDRSLDRERQIELEETTEFVEFDDYMVAINDSGISLVGLDNRYVA